MKRIYIYGTGKYAESFLLETCNTDYEIVGFIETNPTKESFDGKKLIKLNQIDEQFDYIVVASSFVKAIEENMQKNRITKERVIYLESEKIAIYDGILMLGEDIKEEWCYFRKHGVYTNSRKYIDRVSDSSLDCSKFWIERDDFSSKTEVTVNSIGQKKMIDEKLIPILNKTQTLCDFACGAGEWSEYLSPYVSAIDAYDISSGMINTARQRFKMKGIDNVSFIVMDSKDMSLQNEYDNFLLMGLFTYIEDYGEIHEIIRKAVQSLKKNGLLIVRDTLNASENSDVYLYKKWDNNYIGVYHRKTQYEKMFIESGLEIEECNTLSQYESNTINTGSIGYIFRKK